MNPARDALTRAINRAAASGAPRFVNLPPPTIYSQLVPLAKPIVTAYFEDLTVHDRKTCRNLRVGDQIFWLANPCGTHLVLVRHDAEQKALELNREYFRAVVSNHPDREWKAARCTHDRGRGTVSHITPDAVEMWFNGRFDRLRRLAMEALADA